MIPRVSKILKRAQNLDKNLIWIESMDEQVQDEIIRLNTEDQLGDKGIDSLDQSLGDYAPFTVRVRSSLGLQTDHIDFKVTGEYWESWDTEVRRDVLVITVNESRYDELVNDLGFSPEHVGLTIANWDKVIREYIQPNWVESVKKQLLSA